MPSNSRDPCTGMAEASRIEQGRHIRNSFDAKACLAATQSPAQTGSPALNSMQQLRRFAKAMMVFAKANYVNLSWKRHRRHSIPHKLPGRLTITLTSYPPRYPALALTLRSLLSQRIRPDSIYLWIADSDLPSLPGNVTDLQKHGVTIRTCRDLRSYKKIIPALEYGIEGFLLTADDDVYYPRNWLRQIIEAYRADRKEVICARAHRIRLNEQGTPLPYLEWEGEVTAAQASRLIFPTGCGGALFAPGIFHTDVTRTDIFQETCPTADDVWLYWMAALAGASFRKVGDRWRLITWTNSQRVALNDENNSVTDSTNTANDIQIANMVARYGFPGARQ